MDEELRAALSRIETQLQMLSLTTTLALASQQEAVGPLAFGGGGGGGGREGGGGGGGGGGLMGDGAPGGSGHLTIHNSIPTEVLDWLRDANPELAASAPQPGEGTGPFWSRVVGWLGSASAQVPASVLGAVIAASLGG